MKKIRITIDNLEGGGAEKVLIKLLQKLNNKYEIDLFLITKSGIYLEDVPSEINIDYNFKKLFSKNIVGRIKNSLEARIKDKIYSIDKSFIYNLNKKEYDYEISFLEGCSTEIVSKSKNKKSKKIAWVHIDLLNSRVLSIEKEKQAYSSFDKIVCVSEEAKKSFLKLYPEYTNKVKVIYNILDEKEILEKSREDIRLKKDRLNFLAIGRLEYQKGYDLLLEAVNNLKNQNLHFKLLILGIGSQENNLKEYILENNLQNYVEMLGFKKNPYPYIREADVFISSSRYEGFSLVIAEAMILGKPIIGTNCVGPTELLENGKYGVLVPTEDIQALECSMKNFILDKNRKKYYSELSKERKKIFNSNEVLENICKILD